MIGVINTTTREDNFSAEVAKRVSDILLNDNMSVIRSDIQNNGISDVYLKGYESELLTDIEAVKKIIYVIPSYYKNMPSVFTDWIYRLSKEQMATFDNKPIMIVSVQDGKSIDSLPETIIRNTICNSIKYFGYMPKISPNWVGCTPEWFEVEGSNEKFKDMILDFANNYE